MCYQEQGEHFISLAYTATALLPEEERSGFDNSNSNNVNQVWVIIIVFFCEVTFEYGPENSAGPEFDSCASKISNISPILKQLHCQLPSEPNSECSP